MSAEVTSSPRILENQIAVVTGGGRGIGRAIAQALAAAGATVAALARSANELEQTVTLIHDAGGKAHAYPVDITDGPSVRRTISDIHSALGPVDLLINNAGVIGPLGPFWENDIDDWWRAMDINLRGQVLCAHAVLPEMISRRRGRIVNVSSGAGTAPIANLSSYVAAKTALIRFTENLAAETKPYNVSIFAIAPGTVRTAMAEYSLNSPEAQKWIPWFKRLFDEGINVPPERAAQLALALASGRADAISGRFITVQDNLDLILENAAEVEKAALYCLRVSKLAAEKPNPAYASLLATAGRGSS